MKWFSFSVLGSQKKFWVEKGETGWERARMNVTKWKSYVYTIWGGEFSDFGRVWMWGCADLTSAQYGLHNTGEGRFLDLGRMWMWR